MHRRALFSCLVFFGCGGVTPTPTPTPTPAPAPTTAKPTALHFDYLDGHFLVVGVRVNDALDTRFVLDTGMGVNLVSDKLCDRFGCQRRGSHTGKRMSGQDVTMPLATLASIQLGDHRAKDVQVGTFDFEARNFGIDPSVTGFLALTYFATQPFTLDYGTRSLILETDASLAERVKHGSATPVRLDVDGPALDIFMPLEVAGKERASVEVDTGSPALTLDERFLGPLGIDAQGGKVKRVQNEDETGYAYTRFFALDPIPVRVLTTPPAASVPVKTMFQKLIYDGLLGDAYLKHFVVTFDLPRARLIFAPLPG